MCGIAGLIAEKPSSEVLEVVERALQLQEHRGPDDHGVHAETTSRGSIALGTRRLAIIDTSPLGHQPMVNPQTGDVLAYNGEIYNFRGLRTHLESKGFVFRSDCDSEVLLRGFEHWGGDVITKLEGMFAFAIWSPRCEKLFLGRDPLGIKPLYYTGGGNGLFGFSSETMALTRSGISQSQIDNGSVAGYLAYGSIPEPSTIFERIKALPPGSWMEVDTRSRTTRCESYWDFPEISESHTDPLEVDEALVRTAVNRHLQSDVPLGVFLSSGLDSSIVLGFAEAAGDGTVRAFTVRFPDDLEFDESSVASNVARKAGIKHELVDINHHTALAWAQESLAAMDQPAADGLNTFIVSKAARGNGLTVALSGLGGDEIFGGYKSFEEVPRFHSLLKGRLNPLPAGVRRMLARIAARGKSVVAQEKARDLASSRADLVDLYLAFRRNFSDGPLKSLGLDHAALGLRPTFMADDQDLRASVVQNDDIATISRLESRFYLRNTLLRDSDVFGMANSLEIRVPFLDTPLIENIMSLPGTSLLPNGSADKYRLRKLGRDFLVPEQMDQPKRGFVLPLGNWMQGPMRGLVASSLEALSTIELLDGRALSRITDSLGRSSDAGSSFRLWSLVALGHWIGRNNSTEPTR